MVTAEIIPIDSGSVVKADTGDGYFKMANVLQEALIEVRLNGSQFRFVNLVIRSTYGWKKKAVEFDREAFSEALDLSINEVSRIKTALHKAHIIEVDGKDIGMNTYVSEWEIPAKRVKKSVGLHTNFKILKCVIPHYKVCNRTLINVQFHTKSALPSLYVKDSIKDNSKDNANHASRNSEEDEKFYSEISIKSKDGKKRGSKFDYELAKDMANAVAERTMSNGKEDLIEWSNIIRLMREQDLRKPKHIVTLFNFANQDSWLAVAIVSPKALRRNWPMVASKYQEAKAKADENKSQDQSQKDYVSSTTCSERINDSIKALEDM